MSRDKRGSAHHGAVTRARARSGAQKKRLGKTESVLISLCRFVLRLGVCIIGRHRPKSQDVSLTLFTSSRDGRDFCFSHGFGFGKGRAHLSFQQSAEVVARQFQAEVLIGTKAFPLATAEHPRVPVQPLEIKHPLSYCTMSRLMHARTLFMHSTARWLAAFDSTPSRPAGTTHASWSRVPGREAFESNIICVHD